MSSLEKMAQGSQTERTGKERLDSFDPQKVEQSATESVLVAEPAKEVEAKGLSSEQLQPEKNGESPDKNSLSEFEKDGRLAAFIKETKPYKEALEQETRKGLASLYEMLPHDDSPITQKQIEGLIAVTDGLKRFFPAVQKALAEAIVGGPSLFGISLGAGEKLYKLPLSEFTEKCMDVEKLQLAINFDAGGMAMTAHINKTLEETKEGRERAQKVPYAGSGQEQAGEVKRAA